MRTVRVAILLVLTLSTLGYAQAPSTGGAAPAASAQAANRLPVRRVVLYKSGVGYFEHLGRVRDNQTITIDFTSSQLDDVLKSLTAIDLGGGRISGVNYNSEAGLERRLAGLRLPVGQGATRAQFLAALRGARLEVRDGVTRITGRLLSVEQTSRRQGTDIVTVDTLSLVTDSGDLQTIALEPRVAVRILETDLNQEVAKYLSLLGSVRDQDLRRMTLAAAGTGDRDVFISYVSEVPVWKATYRLVLPDAKRGRAPLLQGWAIVDNTVGEDWDNVQLSLVAGAPQSFIQAVSRPYYVQRPIVPLPERALLAPQTHRGALATAGAGALSGTVRDGGGGVIPGVQVTAVRAGERRTAVTDRNGAFSIPDLPPGAYEVTFTIQGFRPSVHRLQVTAGMEGVLNGVLMAGGLNENVAARASTVNGLPQSSINATLDGVNRRDAFFDGVTGGADAGGAGVVTVNYASALAAATGEQLGDLFEYRLNEPITIRKNQSALVPIFNAPVEAEKVSLWAPATGNRALRAVWLKNTSGNTLDAGTFSIQEDQAFAGEGLIEPLKPNERRLLSYAVDLALVLKSDTPATPSTTTRIRAVRGQIVRSVEERRRSLYTVRNEDREPRTLIIEHPVRPGWTIGGAITADEVTATAHRFRLTIDPQTTRQIEIDETRPVESSVSLTSLTDDQLSLMVRDQALSPGLQARLEELQRAKAEVARLSSAIARLEAEAATITADQQRVRENMQALRGSSEERQLVQRYVRQLNQQEDRLAAVRGELAAIQAERARAQAAVIELLDKMGD